MIGHFKEKMDTIEKYYTPRKLQLYALLHYYERDVITVCSNMIYMLSKSLEFEAYYIRPKYVFIYHNIYEENG